MAFKQQGQQSFEFKTWGGKRKGAGRPPKGPRSSEPHQARVRFSSPTPAHITLRVIAPISTLRRPDMYHAIRRSMYTVVGRSDFRIVHLSIERNHLHLIVEADDHTSLYSSGPSFDGWAELDGSQLLYPTPDYPRLSVCRPKSWLLRAGWRKAGPISMRDIPGPQ